MGFQFEFHTYVQNPPDVRHPHCISLGRSPGSHSSIIDSSPIISEVGLVNHRFSSITSNAVLLNADGRRRTEKSAEEGKRVEAQAKVRKRAQKRERVHLCKKLQTTRFGNSQLMRTHSLTHNKNFKKGGERNLRQTTPSCCVESSSLEGRPQKVIISG